MKKKWRSWLLLAVPYLLTALIPVISVLFLSNTILTNYQENTVADKQSSLQAAADRMQQKCDSIEQLTVLLSNSAALNRYSTACLNQSTHTSVEFLELQSLFVNASTNPVIYDIILYDKKDDSAISSSVALSNTEYFFRYNYVLVGGTYRENIDRLDSMPRNQRYCPEITVSRATSDGGEKRIVEYRMFLPIGWVREMQCQLIVAMETEKLFEDIRDAIPAGGEFYVYDGNGTLIYSDGTRYKDLIPLTERGTLHPLSHEGTSLHGAVLQSGQWKVKVFVPNLVDDGNSLSFRSPSFIVFVILPMLLCVLLALAFTNKNFRGVQDLLGLFRGHTDEHPGEQEVMNYQLVRRYVHQVIAEKNQMTQQITQYGDSRKYEVLDKLVRNTYNTLEEATQALAEANLAIREGRNLVACIRCSEASFDAVVSEGLTVRETIRQVIGGLLEQPYVLFDTATNETTCIISLQEGENPDFLIQGIISQLSIELTYHYDIEFHIGVGSVVPSLYLIHESYNQARQVLYYSEAYGTKINLYTELSRFEEAYYFPRDYDERICNYVIAGREEEAKSLLWEIYGENFAKDSRIPSACAIKKLKRRLWECVTSLAEKYEISLDPLEEAQKQLLADTSLSKRSGKRYFDAVGQALDYLADEIRSKRKPVQSNAIPLILKYVQENYCDSNLTVKQVAAVVGMHENYISYIFKNACGENLSMYIERLRIEKALDMVRNTDMMIRDIAEAVGYVSDNSFRRSFKKITGFTPTECRDPCCDTDCCGSRTNP